MGTLGVLASHSPTTMDLKCDDFVPPLTRSPPLDYLGSGTSGGITGALASILSSMCVCKRGCRTCYYRSLFRTLYSI